MDAEIGTDRADGMACLSSADRKSGVPNAHGVLGLIGQFPSRHVGFPCGALVHGGQQIGGADGFSPCTDMLRRCREFLLGNQRLPWFRLRLI